MQYRVARWFFYVGAYSCIVIATFFVLRINIKTVPIIEARQLKLIELKALEEKNKILEYELLQKTSLDKIDHYVSQHLKMAPPKKVTYLQ